MLAAALMTGNYVLLETVSNDLCSYMSQTGDLRSSPSDSVSIALFSNNTEAPWLCSQRSNRIQPSTTHAVWHREQLSLQQSPPSSLVTVSPVLFVHLFCCNRLLPNLFDSLQLQQAQPSLAHRCSHSWPTHDNLRTLASITDTMTSVDLLSKGVLQTLSFTGTKDSSHVSAPTTPMQKRVLQPDKGTEALQTHCPDQRASELKVPNGKHSCPSSVYHQRTRFSHFCHQCTYLSHFNLHSGSPDDKRCTTHCTQSVHASMQHATDCFINMAIRDRIWCSSCYAHRNAHA